MHIYLFLLFRFSIFKKKNLFIFPHFYLLIYSFICPSSYSLIYFLFCETFILFYGTPIRMTHNTKLILELHSLMFNSTNDMRESLPMRNLSTTETAVVKLMNNITNKNMCLLLQLITYYNNTNEKALCFYHSHFVTVLTHYCK